MDYNSSSLFLLSSSPDLPFRPFILFYSSSYPIHLPLFHFHPSFFYLSCILSFPPFSAPHSIPYLSFPFLLLLCTSLRHFLTLFSSTFLSFTSQCFLPSNLLFLFLSSAIVFPSLHLYVQIFLTFCLFFLSFSHLPFTSSILLTLFPSGSLPPSLLSSSPFVRASLPPPLAPPFVPKAQSKTSRTKGCHEHVERPI